MIWSEFKPVVFFLARFLGLYVALNICYALFITSFQPVADPVTKAVTEQTAWLLAKADYQTSVQHSTSKPTSTIFRNQKPIVSVYEGCNGINVMIVFAVFLTALGPWGLRYAQFLLGGLLVLYSANLVRVGSLFFVALYWPHQLYFFHKYLFTAGLFAFVLAIWFIWIKRVVRKSK